MKTLLVVSDRKIGEHTGEEWDDYIEVPHQPTTDIIQEWANRIRGRIRKLHVEDVKEIEEKDLDDTAGVEVHLDAASPFNAMLLNLQIIMDGEEDIPISLPHADGIEVAVTDPEILETIEKLDQR